MAGIQVEENSMNKVSKREVQSTYYYKVDGVHLMNHIITRRRNSKKGS